MKNNLLFSQTTALCKTLGKRPVMVLTMLLIVGIGQAWGTDATISSFTSISGKFGDVSYNSYKGGGTSNPAANSGAIRLYQNANGNTGGYIVLSVPDGYTITSATIKSTMATTTGYYIDSNPGATTPAKANFEVSNKSLSANTAYTVSGLSTQYITFACFGTSSSSRLYVSYLSVTYQSAAAQTYNVTLSRNGVTETISDVKEGTALDDIAGTGDQGGCSPEWVFEGWSKNQRSAQNNTAVMDLVTTVDGAGPYYAVYSHTAEGGGGSTTVAMSSFSTVSGNVNNDANVSYEAAKGTAGTAPAVNDSQIRIYQNGGTLTITGNNEKKLTSITIGSAMATTVSYIVDSGTESSNKSISANGKFTLNNIEASSVLFTCKGTDKNSRLYLNYLSVTYSGGNIVYYTTSPECSTETSYSVTSSNVQNCSIKFSKTGEGEFTDTQLTGLEEGDYAHFVVNPTLGYTLSGAPSVKDASDNKVECVDMEGIWMFEMPASNVTVSASCTPKEYKITIDDAIENGTASATHFVAVMGTSITLTPKPAAGYQFKSWKVTKEGGETITVTNNQFTMPASDVTVSAEFTPIIYTITYKNDEHINYTSATPETITIKDTGFELEYSVEDGYELTGVTVTMGGEELVLEEEYLWDKTYMLILPEIDVIGNIIVTFETVATCTQLPTISAATSSDITQTTAMLSCSGISSLGSAGCSITSYGFVWGTTTNPTTSNNKVQVGTTYTTTGTAFSNKLTGLTANTTYYVRPYATNGNGTAYGTEISFKTLDVVKLTTPTNLSVSNLSCSGVTLAWDKVDGASSYQLIRTNKSTSSPITTQVDQKDNPSVYCTLSAGTSWSWTVQAIGDGLTYNSSEVATGEDFTLHYTITYDENGGTTVGDDCGTTLPSELPTTTKSHHTFAGWYMDKELNTPAEAGSVINTNTTLYAKWEEIKFTITWSINENTTNSQELQEGTTINPPADLDAATYACEDKVFVGWVGESIDGSINEEPDFITDFGNVEEDKTYYAVFATPSGDGFTLGQSGDFTIYANLGNGILYATNLDNGKLGSTAQINDAVTFIFTHKGNNQYTISNGSKYLALKAYNSTDLQTQNDEYLWTIASATDGKGSWRVTSVNTPSRAIIYRSGYDFKAYGTNNINTNGYYDIEIGGATTYTEYVTSCVTCENVLTIIKGNEENGIFTLDKVGEQKTCDGLSVLVTPNPAEHYHVASVTASTGETAVNNDDGTYTITYAANSTGESTINVVFEEDTKYTVTWMVNGLPYTIGAPSTTVYAGEHVATLPTLPKPNAYCGDVFVGWTTVNPVSGNFNEAPTVYNEQATFPTATGDQTFYAVFADYDEQQ